MKVHITRTAHHSVKIDYNQKVYRADQQNTLMVLEAIRDDNKPMLDYFECKKSLYTEDGEIQLEVVT